MPKIRTTAFVGRHHELGVLDDALRQAERSDPSIVLVEGEPGIGKTALMRQFLRRHCDVRTVWVSGDETETSLEFGVADQLRAAEPAAAIGAGAPGRDSFAVGAELLAVLSRLEEHGTVIVVVDDLHWADLASNRALLFCLRRLRDDSVLVVLASRPHGLDQLGESWARLIADSGRSRRMRLGGLSAGEVQQLAAASGQDLPAGAGDRLRAHTGGNPLYVAALLDELAPGVLREHGATLPAPHSYAATVLSRTSRMSGPARDLLAAGAVLGNRYPAATAAAMVAADLGDQALDELVHSGLVVWRTRVRPEEFEFAHPLVRAAVYEDLSPVRRHALHLRAAELMDPAAALAHRVAAAEGSDAQLAAQLADAAQQESTAGRPLAAAEHLLWFARLASSTEAAEDALLRAVELLLIGGDVASAQLQAEAVDRCADRPHKRFVRATYAAAAGQLTVAADGFGAVLEQVSPRDDPALFGRSAASLALVSTVLGRQAESIRWARAALEVAGDRPTVDLIARQSLMYALAKTGRTAEALALVPVDLATEAHPTAFDAEFLSVRADVLTWSGAAVAGAVAARTVVRWAHAGTPPNHLANCYVTLAEAEQRAGMWDDAVDHAELAASLVVDTDHIWYGPRAHAIAVGLYACRGEWDNAVTHLRRAAEAVALAPFPESHAFVCLAEASIAWARRDWTAVLAAVGPLRRPRDSSVPADALNIAWWRLAAAEALIGVGDLDEAARLLHESDRAEGDTHPWTAARARLGAALRRAGGDSAAARTIYDAALADEHATRMPFEHALLLLEYGQFLAGTERQAEAVPTLKRARESLWRLHARPFVALVDAALAACGIGALPARPQLLDQLTGREQVIVRLVADGLTNREVATQLYVSAKTVEYHLAHVFTKLGIHSRRQLRGLLAPAHPVDENPSLVR